MPDTYIDYTGDGSTTSYTFPFPYIYQDHVDVFVDTVAVAFAFESGNTVTLSPPPADGAAIRIQRTTSRDPVVDFQDNTPLSEEELDLLQLQSVYIAQEGTERSLALAADGTWEGASRRIGSVADPVNDTDAVNKQYIEQVAIIRDTETDQWDGQDRRIENVGAPDKGTDAVNRDYVASLVTGEKVYDDGTRFRNEAEFLTAIGENLGWDDGDTVFIDGDRKGAAFLFDSNNTDTADNVSLFAPAGGGRFKAMVGRDILTSELGIVDSRSLDQSQKLQDAITVTTNERSTLVFDSNVDCGGAPIWVNTTGTYDSYAAGSRFSWRSAFRTYFRLSNVFLTFGKMYKDVSVAGDGSDLRWAPNSGATSQAILRDLDIEGAVRFHNIEGTLRVDSCKFEPELRDSNFRSALATANWGRNLLNVWDDNQTVANGVNAGGVDTLPEAYPELYALVEFLYCNHMLVTACNFQNGQDFVKNDAGLGLTGYTLSQCSNPTIISGRTVHNQVGADLGDHPIMGGSGLTNARILDQHIEENYDEAYIIRRGKFVEINTQGRPQDTGSLITKPLIRIEDSANTPEDVYISGYLSGPQSGWKNVTAIEIEGGTNVNVSAFMQEFGTGVKISGECEIGRLEPHFGEQIDRRIVWSEHPLPRVEDLNLSTFSPISFMNSSRGGYFDLEAPKHLLREYLGTGVTAVPGLTAAIPASGAEDMTAGVKVATANIYTPTDGISTDWNGALAGAGKIHADSSVVSWFVGFSDAADQDTMPCEITASGAITATAANFAGFCYTRFATGATIHVVARNDSGTPTAIDTGIAFSGSDDAPTMMTMIKRNGQAQFRIGGEFVNVYVGPDVDGEEWELDGPMDANGDQLDTGPDSASDKAVDPGATLGFEVSAHSKTASAVNITIPAVAVRAERDPSKGH
jgi:hypothetical protein